MSSVHSRREFSDQMLKRLAAEPQARAVAGDYALVCTDLAGDVWELFPVALVMTDGTPVSLYDERGGLLAFDQVSERVACLVAKAGAFPDLTAVRAICWLPFDGLAALRMRLAKLKVEWE